MSAERTNLTVASLQQLHMLAMTGMDKPAWQFLGRAIMGGCFPKLEQLFASNQDERGGVNTSGCATLAVTAITLGREATKATAAAVAALGTTAARKKANKKAKTAA